MEKKWEGIENIKRGDEVLACRKNLPGKHRGTVRWNNGDMYCIHFGLFDNEMIHKNDISKLFPWEYIDYLHTRKLQEIEKRKQFLTKEIDKLENTECFNIILPSIKILRESEAPIAEEVKLKRNRKEEKHYRNIAMEFRRSRAVL